MQQAEAAYAKVAQENSELKRKLQEEEITNVRLMHKVIEVEKMNAEFKQLEAVDLRAASHRSESGAVETLKDSVDERHKETGSAGTIEDVALRKRVIE